LIGISLSQIGTPNRTLILGETAILKCIVSPGSQIKGWYRVVGNSHIDLILYKPDNTYTRSSFNYDGNPTRGLIILEIALSDARPFECLTVDDVSYVGYMIVLGQ